MARRPRSDRNRKKPKQLARSYPTRTSLGMLVPPTIKLEPFFAPCAMALTRRDFKAKRPLLSFYVTPLPDRKDCEEIKLSVPKTEAMTLEPSADSSTTPSHMPPALPLPSPLSLPPPPMPPSVDANESVQCATEYDRLLSEKFDEWLSAMDIHCAVKNESVQTDRKYDERVGVGVPPAVPEYDPKDCAWLENSFDTLTNVDVCASWLLPLDEMDSGQVNPFPYSPCASALRG